MIFLVLSSDYFGPGIYGLLIGGIFAAILSTVDSQLLVVASTFVRDLYEKVVKKDMELEEARLLRLNTYLRIDCGVSCRPDCHSHRKYHSKGECYRNRSGIGIFS